MNRLDEVSVKTSTALNFECLIQILGRTKSLHILRKIDGSNLFFLKVGVFKC